MRFLMLYKTIETGVPPTQEEVEEMGAFIDEMTRSGNLISTEGCLPSSKGARVRLDGGKITVTDGPFTEAKELIAGFALMHAASMEEAIELTRRFLKVAGDGETEIRQVYEPSDFGPPPGVSAEQGATVKQGR